MKTILKNEHGLNENCTVSATSNCRGCSIQDKLSCKFERKTLHGFLAIGFPPVLIALFGLVLTGIITNQWWILVGYAIFTFGMLGAVEMFFLCRHCPYYDVPGNTIVCIGNYGSLKLLPYNPAPMNRFERFCMRAFVILAFFVFPLAGNGYGIYMLITRHENVSLLNILCMAGITFSLILSSITFVVSLTTWFCTKCVNFSCPFNKVPKETVNTYLQKNPKIKEAWNEYYS